MHFGFAFLGALILLPGATPDTQQNHPAEIPSQFKAIGFKLNFASAKTITVAATSRRPENPDTPEDLDHLRKKVLNTLRKIPLTVAADGTSPDLSLELIVEPNVRYGMFHSQNAPYIYLLVREHSHGPWCTAPINAPVISLVQANVSWATLNAPLTKAEHRPPVHLLHARNKRCVLCNVKFRPPFGRRS